MEPIIGIEPKKAGTAEITINVKAFGLIKLTKTINVVVSTSEEMLKNDLELLKHVNEQVVTAQADPAKLIEIQNQLAKNKELLGLKLYNTAFSKPYQVSANSPKIYTSDGFLLFKLDEKLQDDEQITVILEDLTRAGRLGTKTYVYKGESKFAQELDNGKGIIRIKKDEVHIAITESTADYNIYFARQNKKGKIKESNFISAKIMNFIIKETSNLENNNSFKIGDEAKFEFVNQNGNRRDDISFTISSSDKSAIEILANGNGICGIKMNKPSSVQISVNFQGQTYKKDFYIKNVVEKAEPLANNKKFREIIAVNNLDMETEIAQDYAIQGNGQQGPNKNISVGSSCFQLSVVYCRKILGLSYPSITNMHSAYSGISSYSESYNEYDKGQYHPIRYQFGYTNAQWSDAIKREIDMGKPCILYLDNHYVVVVGYQLGIDQLDMTNLLILDPYLGKLKVSSDKSKTAEPCARTVNKNNLAIYSGPGSSKEVVQLVQAFLKTYIK